MVLDDEIEIVDGATTDHEVRVTLAEAFAEDHGPSQVESSEVRDQNSGKESRTVRFPDTPPAEPQGQSTTSKSTSVMSSGGRGGGVKSTLAQLLLEDTVAEGRPFSGKLSPISEITEITIAETQGTISVEPAVAESEGPSTTSTFVIPSGSKDGGRSTTLQQLLEADKRDSGDRILGESSSPATTAAIPVDHTISVILFGRTGSGKSTLAQMLTLGNLDPESEDFVSSSGIRGETKELKDGKGRGWRVVDTPGFGEPRDPQRTVSSEEAERKIKKYIQMIEGTYTHFLYTVMRDRIDELDKRLWKFFVRLFGESIKTNFSVVISDASAVWTDQNRADLVATFTDCDSFLSAEFPPVRSGDPEWEVELAEIRTASLEQLEMELAELGRHPVECSFAGGGFFPSSGASLKRMAMSVLDKASSGISGVFGRLLEMSGLLENGRCLLEPQISFGKSTQ